MSFADDARRARAITEQSRLRSAAAKFEQQWRELQETLAQLQGEMAEVKERLARLEQGNGQQ